MRHDRVEMDAEFMRKDAEGNAQNRRWVDDRFMTASFCVIE